jgi:hypothetical protein
VAVDVAWIFLHTVTVEAFLGETSTGKKFGPPRPVSCLITVARKLVTNAEGREVVSERGFLCGPGEAIGEQDQVTIRGTVTHVVATSLVDSGGWPTPDNLEVSCA